jgi:hypothetical protein
MVVDHNEGVALHTVELSMLVLNDLSRDVSGGEILAHPPILADVVILLSSFAGWLRNGRAKSRMKMYGFLMIEQHSDPKLLTTCNREFCPAPVSFEASSEDPLASTSN